MKKILLAAALVLSTAISVPAVCTASCDSCSGSGYCEPCGGSGTASIGGTCLMCNGSKKCNVCSGSGEF